MWRSAKNVNETLRTVPYVSVLRCPLIDIPNGNVEYSSSERVEHSVARMACIEGFYDVHGANLAVNEFNPVSTTCVRTYGNAPAARHLTRGADYISDVAGAGPRTLLPALYTLMWDANATRAMHVDTTSVVVGP